MSHSRLEVLGSRVWGKYNVDPGFSVKAISAPSYILILGEGFIHQVLFVGVPAHN